MFLVDIAREAGVSYNTLRHRVTGQGWSVERAIAEPPPLPSRGRMKMVEFRGETLSQRQWAERLGITCTSLRARLINWPIEEALSTVGRREIMSGAPGLYERDQTTPGCPKCGLHGEHVCTGDVTRWIRSGQAAGRDSL